MVDRATRLGRPFGFLLSMAVILGLSPPLVQAEDRPNIIVFLVDDMGVMDTSVPFLTDESGQAKKYPLNNYYRTPNMERLAAQGVRFNNFNAMSVCSPTRISIMTGQNAARHRSTNWINPETNNGGDQGPPDWRWTGLPADAVTLPGLLRGAGYRTIHIGKGHFGAQHAEGADPKNLGFDRNIGGAAFGAPGSYYGTDDFGWAKNRAHHAVPHLDKYHGQEIYLTEALTIEANAQIRDAVQDDQPFYLYMAHYAVHGPFQKDPRYIEHYRDSGKPENAKAFATMIEGMDKSLGDILDQLESLGIAENTLIFFLGDNGTDAPLGHEHRVACAAPLRGKKGSHYEGGMRVPMIAAWGKPDPEQSVQQRFPIRANGIQAQLAAVYDLFPTILDVAQVSIPPSHVVDGVNLKSLAMGDRDDSRDEVFLMHYPHGVHRSSYFTTYRSGDWKVIYHYFPSEQSGGQRYQLFQLANDPFESTDLATTEPERLKRMVAEMAERLEEQHADYPIRGKDDPTPVKPMIP